jgi:hypothetical protein
MMLKPKPAPEGIATVERGIDVPQPVQTCLRPPYPRREDYVFGTPFAFVEGRSEVDGHCVLDTLVVSTWTFIGLGAIPQVGTSTAWVGGDFPVPDGISSYEVTVDYDWSCHESAYAVIGTAVAGGGVEIQIDRGMARPPSKSRITRSETRSQSSPPVTTPMTTQATGRPPFPSHAQSRSREPCE